MFDIIAISPVGPIVNDKFRKLRILEWYKSRIPYFAYAPASHIQLLPPSLLAYIINSQRPAAAAVSVISLLHRSGMLETGFQRVRGRGGCCDVSELEALELNWTSMEDGPE